MSTAVRRALYGKLAGDTTLNALLGTPATGYSKSIYHQEAPDGASLSISGSTLLYLRRQSDVEYPEVDNGVRYSHAGALYRLVTT
jgi:hypothetical protein